MARANKFTSMAFTSGRSIAFILWIFTQGCAASLSGALVPSAGRLTNSDEARINVTRLDQVGKTSSQILKVEPDGRFTSPEHLEEGIYLIEALVPGYEVASERIDTRSKTSVILNLKPIPEKTTISISITPNENLNRGDGHATLAPPKM